MHSTYLNSVVVYGHQGSEHSGVGAKQNASEHIRLGGGSSEIKSVGWRAMLA